MIINDEMKRERYFKDAQEGEIFRYFADNGVGELFYCIKTEDILNIYEDDEVVVNAVDLETGELLCIRPYEKIIMATAKLIVE